MGLRDARMLEALRLTRAGRLTEATGVIQSLLAGASGTAGAPSRGMSLPHLTIDGTAERLDEVPVESPRAKEPGPPTDGTVTPAGDVPTHSGLRRQRHGFAVDHQPIDSPALAQFARYARHTRPLVSVPDGAQFVARNFTGPAGSRDYKLYVPSSYGDTQMPLIVMLHGCTQSADDFAAGTQMNALAEEHGFLVAYPIQAKSANGSGCWNWFKPAHQRRDRGEPSLIAGMTCQIASDHAIDPDRIYVAGLSAGGAAAVVMGAAYPEVFAAVGVHSGLPAGAAHDLPSALAVMRQGPSGAASANGGTPLMPTIVFHGAQDKTVHPGNGHRIIEQSVSGRSVELRREHHTGRTPAGRAYSRSCQLDAAGRTLLEMWLVDGSGHAWSGGDAAGSFTDPDGPPASREMVRFFLQHRRLS